MKQIGFITSTEDPDLVSDDRLVLPHLQKHGWSVKPIVWDSLTPTALTALDALIFRSCWNYHRKHDEFLKFLKALRDLTLPICNPLSVIEWNLDKSHIIEFAPHLLVPKTILLKRGTSFSLALIADWPSEQLVVKPAVSLNGHDTYLVPIKSAETITRLASEILLTRDVLVQEFIPEVQSSGELSLVYLNGKFSHAVRKVPAVGEFRVHQEYGGSRTAAVASAGALAYGEQILRRLPEILLYARVDLVESARGPILIELEVTDPMLYLATQESAPKNFAQAIFERLK